MIKELLQTNWIHYLWIYIAMVMIYQGAKGFIKSIVDIILTTDEKFCIACTKNFAAGVLSFILGLIILINEIF